MHFILQICIFIFLPVQFYFFALSATFSFVFLHFLALARPAFDIFQKFQRILKEGLNALLKVWHTYVCKEKKTTQKATFLTKPHKKNTQFIFVSRLRSTKLKLDLNIYIGQVKFYFEQIRTINIKNCVYYFYWNSFKILILATNTTLLTYSITLKIYFCI